jgi:hypothetical protein
MGFAPVSSSRLSAPARRWDLETPSAKRITKWHLDHVHLGHRQAFLADAKRRQRPAIDRARVDVDRHHLVHRRLEVQSARRLASHHIGTTEADEREPAVDIVVTDRNPEVVETARGRMPLHEEELVESPLRSLAVPDVGLLDPHPLFLVESVELVVGVQGQLLSDCNPVAQRGLLGVRRRLERAGVAEGHVHRHVPRLECLGVAVAEPGEEGEVLGGQMKLVRGKSAVLLRGAVNPAEHIRRLREGSDGVLPPVAAKPDVAKLPEQVAAFEELQHEILVVAAQEDRLALVANLQQQINHLPGRGTVVHVVAQKDNLGGLVEALVEVADPLNHRAQGIEHPMNVADYPYSSTAHEHRTPF